jgi:hypothetical protein
MSSPIDLTTLTNLESWLGLASGNEDEPLLARLITAVSAYIETWCDRQFASQSYSEVRDGTGALRMAFAQSPVTAVASVAIDGNAIPPGDAVMTPGFYFTPTMLMLNGYEFCRGLGNVALSYTAGFAATPPDVEQACIELAAMRYREMGRIGVASKSVAGESTSFVIKDMPPSVATILAPWRRVLPL